MKKLLNYLLLFSIICVFFWCCFLYLLSIDSIDFKNEIPLNSIQNVQYKNNRVYVGVRDYNRIIVYDEKGLFIKTIRTFNNSKSFWFKILDSKENKVVLKPFPRDFDTTTYKQIDAEININRGFPLDITVETPNKFIIIKNSFIFYLSFNLLFFWLMFGILSTLFFTLNKKDLESLKTGNKSRNTLLLIKPLLKKVFFESKFSSK